MKNIIISISLGLGAALALVFGLIFVSLVLGLLSVHSIVTFMKKHNYSKTFDHAFALVALLAGGVAYFSTIPVVIIFGLYIFGYCGGLFIYNLVSRQLGW